MDLYFCRRCGSPLTNVNGHVFKCENDHVIFANSSPTVGIFFVTEQNEVFLSVRGIEPHKGMLDSFGGFLDGAETFEEAASRELVEELGLTPDDYEPLQYLTSGTGQYLYRNETLPIISVMFWSRLKPGVSPSPADDVADIQTIPLSEVDMALLHDDDIRTGIIRLQQILLEKHV